MDLIYFQPLYILGHAYYDFMILACLLIIFKYFKYKKKSEIHCESVPERRRHLRLRRITFCRRGTKIQQQQCCRRLGYFKGMLHAHADTLTYTRERAAAETLNGLHDVQALFG